MIYIIHIFPYPEEIRMAKKRSYALTMAHQLVKEKGLTFGEAQHQAWEKTGRKLGFKAFHYVGWIKHESRFEQRMREHRTENNNKAARILQVATELGLQWEVVRTMDGNENEERRIKGWKNTPKLCPCCNPKALSSRHFEQKRVSDLAMWENYFTRIGETKDHRKRNWV